jgi:3-hydroxyacyl-CoA dehydrogenase/enoyl-CoA hydratase/3-hydroxybutyryl-CoA epimerase
MKGKKIGIIGFGTIGQGLAKLFFHVGAQVFIKTRYPEKIEQFIVSMERYHQKKLRRGKITALESSKRLKEIHHVRKIDELNAMDAIIESTKEDIKIKKQVLSELRSIDTKQTLVATTTSSFSIAELSELLENSIELIGLHFFNPVRLMDLVEIIPTTTTHPKTLYYAIELCKKIGKTPIVVKDSRGFLVNRIFARYLLEACRMLESGAGGIHQIDSEVSHNLMLNGPYYLSDFIGLDVLLKVNENLNEYYGGHKDNKFRVSQSLKRLCEKGRFGRKVGKGYYSYTKQGVDREIDLEITEILEEIQKSSLVDYVPVNKEIALLSMINEAFLCMEEGVVKKAADIDLAMKYGLGMFKGPVEIACKIGTKRVHERLKDMAKEFGERFSPVPLLKNFKA